VASSSLPRQLARTRRFTLGAPRQFTIAPDGSAVLFLRRRAGDDPVACLWALDLATGSERLLADLAALLRERFLGHPAEFPQRYEACSLVRAAPTLARPLLLIHGLADSKVHPANTLRLSSALLAAGRQNEVLLLPGAGHQPLGGPATECLLWRQVCFFRWHLGSAGEGLEHVAEVPGVLRDT
jgi:pimeloyl-ACP methyl ester carboxylesterase